MQVVTQLTQAHQVRAPQFTCSPGSVKRLLFILFHFFYSLLNIYEYLSHTVQSRRGTRSGYPESGVAVNDLGGALLIQSLQWSGLGRWQTMTYGQGGRPNELHSTYYVASRGKKIRYKGDKWPDV